MENGFVIGNIIIFEESIVSICQIRGSCPLCLLIQTGTRLPARSLLFQ